MFGARRATIEQFELAVLCLCTQMVRENRDFLVLCPDWQVSDVQSFEHLSGTKVPDNIACLLAYGYQIHSLHLGSAVDAGIFLRNASKKPEYVIVFQAGEDSNVQTGLDKEELNRRINQASEIAGKALDRIDVRRPVFTGFRGGGIIAAILGFHFLHYQYQATAFNPSPVPVPFGPGNPFGEAFRASSNFLERVPYPDYVIVHASRRPLGGPVDRVLSTRSRVRVPVAQTGEIKLNDLQRVIFALRENLNMRGVSQARSDWAEQVVASIRQQAGVTNIRRQPELQVTLNPGIRRRIGDALSRPLRRRSRRS